jgi:hypothetical protein
MVTDQLSAEVLMDGKVVGQGRVVQKGLPAGQHNVRIRLQGFVTFDTTINPGAGDQVQFIGKALKSSGGS